jgi:hypothetical protein
MCQTPVYGVAVGSGYLESGFGIWVWVWVGEYSLELVEYILLGTTLN